MAEVGLYFGMLSGVLDKPAMTGASPNTQDLEGYKILPDYKQPMAAA